jgi:hypothetical protein
MYDGAAPGATPQRLRQNRQHQLFAAVKGESSLCTRLCESEEVVPAKAGHFFNFAFSARRIRSGSVAQGRQYDCGAMGVL